MSEKYLFPKTELHLHLDGAITPELLFELALERGVALPADSPEALRPYVVYDPECRSVNEYLKKFELPTEILQDAPALERVTYELGRRLAQQGYGYAEIRFAPQIHTKKGLSQREAALAVECGARRAMEENPSLKLGVILCCMSFGTADLNREANLETVALADELQNDVIRAIDLAGAEGFCPLADFSYIFDEARKRGLRYTCHAGDSQGPDTVRDAIEVFGARRIGHGHHIFDDKALCERARDLGVTLEICLTSNIQCETQPSYEEHPAKRLLSLGIPVTLSTDNPVIADTTLDDEYDLALARCGFTERDLVIMNILAARASFMEEDDKDTYIARLREFL